MEACSGGGWCPLRSGETWAVSHHESPPVDLPSGEGEEPCQTRVSFRLGALRPGEAGLTGVLEASPHLHRHGHLLFSHTCLRRVPPWPPSLLSHVCAERSPHCSCELQHCRVTPSTPALFSSSVDTRIKRPTLSLLGLEALRPSLATSPALFLGHFLLDLCSVFLGFLLVLEHTVSFWSGTIPLLCPLGVLFS